MFKNFIKLFVGVVGYGTVYVGCTVGLLKLVSILYLSNLNGFVVGILSYLMFLAYICLCICAVNWIAGNKELE